MHVLAPDLPPESFDAAYSLNCLLHVPDADLPAAPAGIRGLLRPGGLFFLGVWGGDGSAGVLAGDSHDPPRSFCWRTRAQVLTAVEPWFDGVDLHEVDVDGRPVHALTLHR